MSKWEDRVNSHQAVVLLNTASALLDDLDVKKESAPEVIVEIERIRSVLNYARNLKASIDPELLAPGVLNPLVAPLQALLQELQAYKANGNVGHMANANAHLDGLLGPLYQLPSLSTDEQIEGLRESVSSFRRSAGQYLSSIDRERSDLSQDLSDLKARLSEVTDEVSKQKSRLDEAITEYQKQFSQGEAARREESTKLQVEISEQTKSQLKEQANRLELELKRAKESMAAAEEAQKETFAEQRHEIEKLAKEHLLNMQGFRDQAQELLHVIGNTGMAGEFQKAARSARNSVRAWEAVTCLALAGLIAFAIMTYTATSAPASGIVWPEVFARIFVAVTFGVLAAFAVRQVDRYHQTERRNRRYQLELSSIDPYLVNLEPGKRDEVKIRLAEKLFGNAGLDGTSRDSRGGEGTSLDLLRMALETLQQSIKKG